MLCRVLGKQPGIEYPRDSSMIAAKSERNCSLFCKETGRTKSVHLSTYVFKCEGHPPQTWCSRQGVAAGFGYRAGVVVD